MRAFAAGTAWVLGAPSGLEPCALSRIFEDCAAQGQIALGQHRQRGGRQRTRVVAEPARERGRDCERAVDVDGQAGQSIPLAIHQPIRRHTIGQAQAAARRERAPRVRAEEGGIERVDRRTAVGAAAGAAVGRGPDADQLVLRIGDAGRQRFAVGREQADRPPGLEAGTVAREIGEGKLRVSRTQPVRAGRRDRDAVK